MTRVKQTEKTTRKLIEIKKPSVFNLSTEERLQILANLIIDRMIEDQKNSISQVSEVHT